MRFSRHCSGMCAQVGACVYTNVFCDIHMWNTIGFWRCHVAFFGRWPAYDVIDRAPNDEASVIYTLDYATKQGCPDKSVVAFTVIPGLSLGPKYTMPAHVYIKPPGVTIVSERMRPWFYVFLGIGQSDTLLRDDINRLIDYKKSLMNDEIKRISKFNTKLERVLFFSL